ncbi:MAG: hypothetical protein B7Y40_10195, partial [Gammaproteobacteria bacterium 28-57-27]
LYYDHLKAQDLSLRYVDDLSQRAEQHAQAQPYTPQHHSAALVTPRREQVKSLIANLMQQHNVPHINLIKPGIGEATRVLLRRSPGLLILSNQAGNDVTHMHSLAVDKNVPILIDHNIAPYQAIAIIKDIHHASS